MTIDQDTEPLAEDGRRDLIETAHAALAAAILDGSDAPATVRGLPEDELLDLLDTAARRDIDAGREPNTVAAYAQDWVVWQQFCDSLGVDPATVRSGLFYTFVKWLESQDSPPNTIQRRLTGVIWHLRHTHDRNIPPSGGPAADAWERIRQYETQLERAAITLGRGAAVPITAAQIGQICQRIPPTLYGLRDKAMLLIGVYVAARSSELANLNVEDIVLDPRGRGMTVKIRASKGRKTRTVAVPYGSAGCCPVRSWQAWRESARLTEGPAFRGLRGSLRPAPHGGRISRNLPCSIMTTLGRLIGIDLHLTGHSLRRGRITLLFDAGCSVKQVAAISGHSESSRVIHDYHEPADLWTNPAIDMDIPL